MKAVHFGAGNIGRGFLGQLYHESGFETVFVDVATPVVTALNERGAYPLRIVTDEGHETLTIDRVRAVDGRDVEAVARELADARIVSTAVGVNVLPHIAPALANGIEARFSVSDSLQQLGHPDSGLLRTLREVGMSPEQQEKYIRAAQDKVAAAQQAEPLDIIVCENLLNAGPFLRGEVRKHLPEALHPALENRVGFVEASIGRMVPVMTAAQHAEDPLLVCVEPYCELPVDALGFRGPIPDIAHLKPIPNFAAYVERKLFLHNMSHATCAYLGHLRGHAYIAEAIRDFFVRERVIKAMDEALEGLARKHGLDRGPLQAHRDDLVHRYHNRALGDQIPRVGRDPLRKLGPDDRLIGAATMCLQHDVSPRAIALATAAAILYHNDDDPAARELQALRREQGLAAVLQMVCRVSPQAPLARHIANEVANLQREFGIV